MASSPASSPAADGAPGRSPAVPEDVLAAVRGATSVILTGHERPDGDCIGAQAALARVLEALGKRAHVLNPDPVEVTFDYLAAEVPYGVFDGGPLPEHDLIVLLDISELSRCGALAGPLGASPATKLVIDHHVHHGEVWWDHCLVDRSASATGLLVWRLARDLGVDLDPLACAGVFTSLVTDTGWFKYSNTDAETLAVAGELIARGVEPARLYEAIYQRNEPALPRDLARLLARLEYHADGRLALLATAPGEEPFDGDSDLLLDILRSVDGVEVVLFLREARDGRARLSARSKGTFDVNALAREFGGGGHVKASGATLDGPIDLARERLLERGLAHVEAHFGGEPGGGTA